MEITDVKIRNFTDVVFVDLKADGQEIRFHAVGGHGVYSRGHDDTFAWREQALDALVAFWEEQGFLGPIMRREAI